MSGPSARMIAERLYEVTGKRFLVSDKLIRPVDINYGNPNPAVKCEHNSPEFIRLCSNKKEFCDLMAEIGIKSPIYRRGEPKVYPCIVRESLYSYGGRGCHVFKEDAEYHEALLPEEYYWSPFLKCRSEFRVHVLGGEIKKVNKKEWRHDEPEAELPIRNFHLGYYFKLIKKTEWSKWDKFIDVVNKIHGAIKGSFYGLDIAWSPGLKEWVVFEANTACGLDEATIDFYVEYFAKVLGLKINENIILRTNEA